MRSSWIVSFRAWMASAMGSAGSSCNDVLLAYRRLEGGTPEESADDGQPRSPSNGGIYNLELPQWPLRIEAGEPIDEREDLEAIADALLEPINVIDARGRSYSVRANGVVLIRSPHDEAGTP